MCGRPIGGAWRQSLHCCISWSAQSIAAGQTVGLSAGNVQVCGYQGNVCVRLGQAPGSTVEVQSVVAKDTEGSIARVAGGQDPAPPKWQVAPVLSWDGLGYAVATR